jgi:diadenosine tetraphosphate (Ap4A) HIT family hydrolase
MTEKPYEFHPPEHLVILQTEHWVVHHRVDSALPGYIVMGSRWPTNELSLMHPGALAQLGPLLAKTQQALERILKPEHLYIGRYGHTSGHALHFHVMPVCAWVKQSFFNDPRYRVLQDFSTCSSATETDGAELTLYIWREFCENPCPPAISGPGIREVVQRLKVVMSDPEI